MQSEPGRLGALSARELLALGALFLLTLPAVTPRIYASDEIQYFSYLRSLWFDRDVSFENEYRYFYEQNIGRGEGFHATFLELRTEAGRRPNFGTIGAAILWAPFYAVADLIARAMHAAGHPVAVDGFSRPYISAVAYGSAFYGFAAVVLGAAAARRVGRASADAPADRGARARVSPDVAAAVLVWLGTPLFFYMYIAPPFAHAASAFAVALFVTVWLAVRPRWTMGGAIALGASAGLMAMVREQDAFLAAGPAIDYLLTRGREWREGRVTSGAAVIPAAAGLITSALVFTPQLFAYMALNGYPGPSTLVARKMMWSSPHALQVIGSPSHGFFFWTPLAVGAIAGLVVLARRGRSDSRRIAGCALLMMAMQIYVSGAVDSWTVAGAFGQRRFVAITALLVIGLAAALRATPRGAPRLLAGTAVALALWWNLALIAAFGSGLMNRQRLELARNAYTAFVTIPRMAPELALRYLRSRDSFYGRRD